jgi:hypothetical protein
MTKLRPLWLACCLLLCPALAAAADFDASRLSPLWGLPFAGILLSIALCPLLLPWVWHHHYGKIAAGWGLAFLLPFAVMFGPAAAGGAVAHVLIEEYIPFVILLTALFTVAGGIYIRGNLHGSPALNTAILGIGAQENWLSECTEDGVICRDRKVTRIRPMSRTSPGSSTRAPAMVKPTSDFQKPLRSTRPTIAPSSQKLRAPSKPTPRVSGVGSTGLISSRLW